MTVKELIEILQQHDKDMDVVFGQYYMYEVHNARVCKVDGFWNEGTYPCVLLDGDQIGRIA